MKPTDFILCADCGNETLMDRLSPSFGLCPACEIKHQQRPITGHVFNHETKPTQEIMKLIPLKKVKKGGLIKRTPDSKKVYMKSSYNRYLNSYICVDWDDVNRWLMIKADKQVYTGFTF